MTAVGDPNLVSAASLVPGSRSLASEDVSVARSAWQALRSHASLPDAWEEVAVDKALLPRLWAVLGQTRGGAAQKLFILPSLGELVARLPDEVACGGEERGGRSGR